MPCSTRRRKASTTAGAVWKSISAPTSAIHFRFRHCPICRNQFHTTKFVHRSRISYLRLNRWNRYARPGGGFHNRQDPWCSRLWLWDQIRILLRQLLQRPLQKIDRYYDWQVQIPKTDALPANLLPSLNSKEKEWFPNRNQDFYAVFLCQPLRVTWLYLPKYLTLRQFLCISSSGKKYQW